MNRLPAVLALAFAASSALPAAAQPGPAVGETIPRFSVRDHLGASQTFESLRGPQGLVLVFIRSADW